MRFLKNIFLLFLTNYFECSHIKPVWKIKKEYLNNTNNKKILVQISNIYNFLPLSPTIQRLYDYYYFYWTKDGMLQLLKENEPIKEMLNYKNYKKMNESKLKLIKKYINDYSKIIYSKNKDNKNFKS